MPVPRHERNRAGRGVGLVSAGVIGRPGAGSRIDEDDGTGGDGGVVGGGPTVLVRQLWLVWLLRRFVVGGKILGIGMLALWVVVGGGGGAAGRTGVPVATLGTLLRGVGGGSESRRR